MTLSNSPGVRFKRVWSTIIPSWVLLSAAYGSPPNFVDDIQPIFKEHCLSCHNPDKKKADLDLTSVQTIQIGSSGGEIVKAGVPDTSVLYMVMNHHEDFEAMPPKKPKLPKDQLALVHAWIAGGLLESKDGKSQLRKMSFDLSAGSAERPENPAIPGNLPPLRSVETDHPAPVIAMAASPWADLVAVSGNERILFFGKSNAVSGVDDFTPVAASDRISRRSFDEEQALKTGPGKIGKAWFPATGSGDVLIEDVPVDFLETHPEFTISMWVQPDPDMESPVLFGRSSFTIFLEKKQVGWTVRSYTRNQDNGIAYFGRIGEIAAGAWQHIAVASDGKEWTFFLNGKMAARQEIPAGHVGHLARDEPFFLGGDGVQAERLYRGGLDEFCVYGRALEEEEISEMVRDNMAGLRSRSSLVS